MPEIFITNKLIHTLPFNDAMSWEDYQTLCTDLIYVMFNCIDSREYLSKGSAQEGIDIYAIREGQKKCTVAQCKLVKNLSANAIIKIIEEFLNGTFAANTEEFILCTSVDLSNYKDELSITEIRKRLDEKGIKLKIWDEPGLSKELRTSFKTDIINIVARYFSPETALAFYGDIWKDHLKKLHKIDKKKYEVSSNYIERTISSCVGVYEIYQQPKWSWKVDRKKTIINLFDSKEEKPIRTVLLSIAGFGKSMEVSQVAGYFSDENKSLYPIKFSLNNYQGQTIETLLDSFNSEWKNINEASFLLIFDGFDEIKENESLSFTQSLNAFIEIHSQINVLVSSRFNSYNLKHPPLRGFEAYSLDSLTQNDIEDYLVRELQNRKIHFVNLINSKKLKEFDQNPYYLTRMVRFYKADPYSFPKNKTELFNKILFEQIDNDEERFSKPELKEKLLPVAKQIAFCMTIAGKSLLDDAEMKHIVPDAKTRGELKHFSILVRNHSNTGSWSFEHKNLQEYLCASLLLQKEFVEIHKAISFEYNPQKLLPHFLNTVAFLFEIANKDSTVFKKLFEWLNTNEPEVMIRFEREQLAKKTRVDIFCSLFKYYKVKGISLRFTSNFLLDELAFFIGVDNDVIDFLSQQLKGQIPEGLAYDSIRLISYCDKPYLYTDKIIAICDYQFTLKNNYQVQAECIDLLNKIGLNTKSEFEKILYSGVSVDNFLIRKAIVSFLTTSDYFEDFVDDILDSISIFQKGHGEIRYAGNNTLIKELILKFIKPPSIKKVFQYLIKNNTCISEYHHYSEFQFDPKEVQKLFEKAVEVYGVDKSILRVVYSLFRNLSIVSYHDKSMQYFKFFFEQTCGLTFIFKTLYKHTKNAHYFLPFANQSCLDYLLEEYNSGKISNHEMIIYRNIVSHIKKPLSDDFYNKLILISKETFWVDDLDIDYNALNKLQEIKNQEMLLNRDLFFEEADQIFDILSKEKITTKDLWVTENRKLQSHQRSLVLETLKRSCVRAEDKSMTHHGFIKKFSVDEQWNSFVIETILNLLKSKEHEINQNLMVFAKNWCKQKIDTLDFYNSIKDKADGSFTCDFAVEFAKDLFSHIDVDVDDSDLIKLLFSDYESFYSGNESVNFAMRIAEKVRDKSYLKTNVLLNIKEGKLAKPVLLTHYQLCYKLGYTESLESIYKTIVSNSTIKDHTRVTLTKYYLELGGQINDFASFLKSPNPIEEENVYTSWSWYLIDSLKNIEEEKVTKILLEIINSDNFNESNKLLACEYLLELFRIEGLIFWIKYVKEHTAIPFDYRSELLVQQVKEMPQTEACSIIFEMLDYVYEHELNIKLKFPNSVEHVLLDILFSIAISSHEIFTNVKDNFSKLIVKYSPKTFINTIKLSEERLTQQFYKKQPSVIDIPQANYIFKRTFSQ